MRGFFRTVCITLFVLLFPVTLLLALPKLNGYNAKVLKTELRREHAYDEISKYLGDNLVGTHTQGINVSAMLLSQVKAELTPDYVQKKSEAVIDSSADWISGRSQQPPSVSFNDLKGSLLAKHPDVSSQLQQFQDQVKELQAQGGTQLTDLLLNQQNLDPTTKAQLQQVTQQSQNLQSVAQGDYTFSLEQFLTGLKSFYHIYSIVLPVLIGALVVLLVFIGLLGVTLGSRLSGLGWTLAVAAIWNGLLVLVVHMLEGYVEQRASAGANPLVVIAYHSFVNTVMANYVPIEAVVSGVVFAVGLALLITGRMMKSQAPPAVQFSPASPSASTAAVTAPTAGTSPEAAKTAPKQSV